MANYSKYFMAVFYVFIRMMILLLEPKKNQLVNAALNNDAVVMPNFCATRSSPLPAPYTDIPKFICAPLAWHGYEIAFRQQDDVVTIVLSGLYEMNWIGVAVSDNGKMLGSSAVVGWLRGTDSNSSVIKQYTAEGQEGNQVKPDQGALKFGKADPIMVLKNQTIYLAFQLKFDKRLSRQPFLFAAGAGKPGKDSILPNHIFRTAMMVDFSRGTFFLGYIDKNKERLNHGILAVLGWGIITPLGVAFARYLRDFEPTWYYLHSTVQFVGFFVGLAAVAVGKSLYDRTGPDFVYHKVIGYTVLALSVLQVCQFVVRPSRSSKVRVYWNMSHYWVGRLAILLAPVNVVIGLYMGDGDGKLRIAFVTVFGLLIAATIVLEIRHQMIMMKKKRTTNTDLTTDLTGPPVLVPKN